jgi:hypothetical protein
MNLKMWWGLPALLDRQHLAGIEVEFTGTGSACQSNIHRSVSALACLWEYANGSVRDMASSTHLSARLV